MLRAFIALEIPGEIQEAIAHSLSQLQKDLPKPLIRWVASKNVHLTLKFLGDVPPANLESLAAALAEETRNHAAFSFSVGGLGAFPSPQKARVIWVGLQAPPALIALADSIDTIAARLGFTAEDRPFSPHLTIGRVSHNVSGNDFHHIRTVLDGSTIGILGTVQVDALIIFKSVLLSGGPVYSRLYTLPMKLS
jgi:2'-5' RNA ligase